MHSTHACLGIADGQKTFGLPNLQGRAPMHPGQGLGGSTHVLGEMGGTESETLSSGQMPAHTHGVSGGISVAAQIPASTHLGTVAAGALSHAHSATAGGKFAQVRARQGSQSGMLYVVQT